VFIVSDKTNDAYRQMCADCRILPQDMVMVGNSFKSDIVPALAIGASAVYIPFHITWALEHAETFDHDRLYQIERFEELLRIL
jgi:putative hydrolase of the HAD superfamily